MSYLNNVKRGAGATLLAQKSTSYEAFDGGTIARGIPSHTARDFFRKYGTMLHRFDYNSEYNIYYGYVRTLGRPEFLTFVAFKNGYAIIVSYETHMDGIHGPDAWELRKHFADKCFLKVRLKTLTFTPPPPPSPARFPIQSDNKIIQLFLPAPPMTEPPPPQKEAGRFRHLIGALFLLLLCVAAYFYLKYIQI